MKQAYVVEAGVVVNTVMLEDDAKLAEFNVVDGPADVQIGWIFDGVSWSAPAEPASSFEDLRKAKLASITAFANILFSAGASLPSGLHIALDDGSRADLTAMAATATAAASGAVSWPDSYARGWITIENLRIPLATPADGLALAASVGDYYAAIVQHRRDLKDAALAAENAAALDAIDIAAGWPAPQG
ncbi:hypothetical protein [Pleomorphomonas oryzae]|uniref:DUF4376 domain-containing protein n=1 Tax=Pleomorphomonas oryzae TaxID=261934 RepID=UPI0003F721E9|nr:hypothetical protein [Pleomorphomonas oryzae]